MLLPRDANWLAKAQGGLRSTIHDDDAGLAQRLSVSVPSESAAESTPVVAPSQVMPVGAVEAGASDSDSSDSDTLADPERQLPPDSEAHQLSIN
jgi:hypothetical protein